MVVKPSITGRSFHTRIASAVLVLHIVLFGLCLMHSLLAPSTRLPPLIGALILGGLSIALLVVNVVPNAQRSQARRQAIGIAVMLVTITIFAAISGASRSSLVMLFVIPMAAAALAFGSARWVLLVAGLSALAFTLLGALTSEVAIRSSTFAFALGSAVVPACVVALILAFCVEQLHAAAKKIDDLAATDTLTGLLNASAFDEVLQREHRKAERFSRAYSIIRVDVDHSTTTNEPSGSDAGNAALARVADAINRAVRTSDVVARLGNEQFVVLSVESTPQMASAITQRIHSLVASSTASAEAPHTAVTVGVASYPSDHLYPRELLALASQRMRATSGPLEPSK